MPRLEGGRDTHRHTLLSQLSCSQTHDRRRNHHQSDPEDRHHRGDPGRGLHLHREAGARHHRGHHGRRLRADAPGPAEAEQGERGVRPQLREGPSRVVRHEPPHAMAGGGSRGTDCVGQADKDAKAMEKCDEFGHELITEGQSPRNFSLSYADSLSAQGNTAAAAQVENCVEDAGVQRPGPAALPRPGRPPPLPVGCADHARAPAPVINPIIKIVTTVVILGAVYLFFVKPALDTTRHHGQRQRVDLGQLRLVRRRLRRGAGRRRDDPGARIRRPRTSSSTASHAADQDTDKLQRCAEKFGP